jgi:hypothetical protein
MCIRDELARALVCTQERWWDVSGDDVSKETSYSIRAALPIEGDGDRKERLGLSKLESLNKERGRKKEVRVRREKRQDVVRAMHLWFSFEHMYKAGLLMQVAKREGKGATHLETGKLRDWLSEYDSKTMPLNTLLTEAGRRGCKNAKEKNRNQLLKFLRTCDHKQEDERYKKEKEERKLKRKREQEEEESEGEEGEEEEEEEVSE